MLDLHQPDAEYIASKILTHLSDGGYSADNIVSQCYDGALVMSEIRGGVQAMLQNKHLHLVVVHDIQSEPCAKRFFDLSSFFSTTMCLRNIMHLERLLEIRWTSHY